MFLWSAQAIYSRAFYAAGNTLVPMTAGTIVTIVSLPIYFMLFHLLGAMGLAIASDIGILMQTLAIAGLLHRREMVSVASLVYREMGRCLMAALAGSAAIWIVFSFLGNRVVSALHATGHGRMYNLVVLSTGSLLWGVVAVGGLKGTGSALPNVVKKRLRLA